MSLERVGRVLDALPRVLGARVQEAGGCTLFLREGPGWPWAARPRPGADLAAARAALRAHGAPERFEWLAGDDDLAERARAAGLVVTCHPLLVLGEPADVPLPQGATLAEAPLREVLVAQAEAFGGGADLSHLDAHREGLAAGRTALLSAVDDRGEVLGVAMAQRAAGGAEVVGVATIERWRGRGLATALTARMAARLAGDDPVFLTAGDEGTARVYERAGFARAGTACAAEPVS